MELLYAMYDGLKVFMWVLGFCGGLFVTLFMAWIVGTLLAKVGGDDDG